MIRSGDVDPSIIAYLGMFFLFFYQCFVKIPFFQTEKQDLGTSDSIMDSLNKKSGLKVTQSKKSKANCF